MFQAGRDGFGTWTLNQSAQDYRSRTCVIDPAFIPSGFIGPAQAEHNLATLIAHIGSAGAIVRCKGELLQQSGISYMKSTS